MSLFVHTLLAVFLRSVLVNEIHFVFNTFLIKSREQFDSNFKLTLYMSLVYNALNKNFDLMLTMTCESQGILLYVAFSRHLTGMC